MHPKYRANYISSTSEDLVNKNPPPLQLGHVNPAHHPHLAKNRLPTALTYQVQDIHIPGLEPSVPFHPMQRPEPEQQSQPLPQHLSAQHSEDLEKLRRLKDAILAGQHPQFKPVPRPDALASLYLGPVKLSEPSNFSSGQSNGSIRHSSPPVAVPPAKSLLHRIAPIDQKGSAAVSDLSHPDYKTKGISAVSDLSNPNYKTNGTRSTPDGNDESQPDTDAASLASKQQSTDDTVRSLLELSGPRPISQEPISDTDFLTSAPSTLIDRPSEAEGIVMPTQRTPTMMPIAGGQQLKASGNPVEKIKQDVEVAHHQVVSGVETDLKFPKSDTATNASTLHDQHVLDAVSNKQVSAGGSSRESESEEENQAISTITPEPSPESTRVATDGINVVPALSSKSPAVSTLVAQQPQHLVSASTAQNRKSAASTKAPETATLPSEPLVIHSAPTKAPPDDIRAIKSRYPDDASGPNPSILPSSNSLSSVTSASAQRQLEVKQRQDNNDTSPATSRNDDIRASVAPDVQSVQAIDKRKMQFPAGVDSRKNIFRGRRPPISSEDQQRRVSDPRWKESSNFFSGPPARFPPPPAERTIRDGVRSYRGRPQVWDREVLVERRPSPPDDMLVSRNGWEPREDWHYRPTRPESPPRTWESATYRSQPRLLQRMSDLPEDDHEDLRYDPYISLSRDGRIPRMRSPSPMHRPGPPNRPLDDSSDDRPSKRLRDELDPNGFYPDERDRRAFPLPYDYPPRPGSPGYTGMGGSIPPRDLLAYHPREVYNRSPVYEENEFRRYPPSR